MEHHNQLRLIVIVPCIKYLQLCVPLSTLVEFIRMLGKLRSFDMNQLLHMPFHCRWALIGVNSAHGKLQHIMPTTTDVNVN